MAKETEKKLQQVNMVLTQRDGWNFGLGFMAAVFVFSFILIPIFTCFAWLALTSLAGQLNSLF